MNEHGVKLTMMRRVTACLVLVISGCDSAAVLPAPNVQATDTIFLDPVLTIGLDAGDSNYLFGAITSVTADADGRIYVGDRIGTTVRVFDAAGAFVRQLAGPGQGPGELSGRPIDIMVGHDDRLYMRDGTRITVFERRVGGPVPDFVASDTWRSPAGNNSPSRRRLSRGGRYYDPGGRWTRNEHPRFYFRLFHEGVLSGDTLEVPPYAGLVAHRPALLRLGSGPDALMLPGLSKVPFSAVPVWAVTLDGTLLSSDGASSTLFETDLAGDTLRMIRLPEPRVRTIPPGERADSLRALERRIARVPGRLNQIEGLGLGVEERRLPDVPPAVLGLHIGEDGSIWVERWPPEGQDTFRYYDVLDESGVFVHLVVLRLPITRNPAPWFGQDVIVGVVRDSETEVERVVRFDRP